MDATVTESKYLADLDTEEPREVDVVIEGEVGVEAITIGVEVIEWTRRADVTWVEKMLRKHERLPVNKVVLVSWTGFTESALAKIRSTLPPCKALESDPDRSISRIRDIAGATRQPPSGCSAWLSRR